MADLPQAFFLPTRSGSLFCLYHAPQGPVRRGQVLHLHPFAEELNTCRRVSAQFARALASAGFAVLQFDMYGCGDSEGDFGDATWTTWLNNAHEALAELHRRAGEPTEAAPLWLWGVRSGCLLSADLLKGMEAPCHMLWWQPVVSGQQVLQQWLRLDAAKEWLSKDKERPEATLPLSEQLKRGQDVHVGGYRISPELAHELNARHLTPPRPSSAQHGKLVSMDISASPSTPPPGITRQTQLWQGQGWQAHLQSVTCGTFWQQLSNTDPSDLIDASLACVQ